MLTESDIDHLKSLYVELRKIETERAAIAALLQARGCSPELAPLPKPNGADRSASVA